MGKVKWFLGYDFESGNCSGFGCAGCVWCECDELLGDEAIDLIVIHCSSTRENYALTEQALEASSQAYRVRRNGVSFLCAA